MKKEKLAYKAPTSEAFVIRFEGTLCQSPGGKRDLDINMTDGRDEYGDEIDL
ncbi:MAG: hypothetical protein IJ151_06625 [Bacteroidales bacterium]|nr:hypothetical protein [Bacteroidales bacterium]